MKDNLEAEKINFDELIASHVKLLSIVEQRAPEIVDRVGYLNPDKYYITSYNVSKDGESVECRSKYFETMNVPGASGEWCDITFRFPIKLLFANDEDIDNYKKEFYHES